MESGFWSNVPQRLQTKRKSKFNGKGALSTSKAVLSKTKEALSRSNEALSAPKEALSKPKEAHSRPNKAHSRPNKALSTPKKALSTLKEALSRSKEKLNSGDFDIYLNQILIHVIGVIGASCHFGESLESTTRSRCMLLLDSLEMANPRRLKPKIRRFVLDIYRTGDRPEAKHLISRIPFLVPKMKKDWFTFEDLDRFYERLGSLN
ncbi:Telomere length regulation protein TEL2-like isoform B [Glycine soja]|nr:Telomere length regulation protein TEL2-like isoform B [Glycine soja]